MACYFGSDPGIPVVAAAGSIVVFFSVLTHRSGPNFTDRYRRVYLAQYSSEVIRKKRRDGGELVGSFERFLDRNEIVGS